MYVLFHGSSSKLPRRRTKFSFSVRCERPSDNKMAGTPGQSEQSMQLLGGGEALNILKMKQQVKSLVI